MEECEYLLKSLDSYENYKDLNLPKEVNNDDEICDELSPKLHQYSNFSSFCYKLSRNVKNTLLKSLVSRTQDSCEYLNNWLYDDLIKNGLFENKDNISDTEVIKNIPQVWNVFQQIYVDCKFKTYNMSTSDFYNMKYLYDYSKNYKTLESKITLTDNPCKEYYCSYIKSAMDVYSTVQNDCTTLKNKDLCEIFNRIQGDKIPEVLSGKFQCSTEDLNAFLVKGDKFIDKRTQVPPSENAASGTELKVGFSIIGILLLSFVLLYKYTPLGNSLRLLISSKIRTKYFMDDEDSHSFSQNTWDSKEEQSQTNGLHVTYEPI
ncbi:PIR Superfamily Protein [Plasmodium ovale curtisi]|uniref:PIR Superfamily Protein n=1 Tax=Plasmodium ovale curtisi TaxID=864141 RepID=A0A1A8X5H3_PLAOA|nr:PIR Superfamily Protein [Plasmodium ovale curtisi]